MLQWVTAYIDKNSQDWEKSRITRIEKEKRVLEKWDSLARQEKQDEIMLIREAEKAERQENQESKDKKKRKEKLEKAAIRSSSWKVWRETKKPEIEVESTDQNQTHPHLVEENKSTRKPAAETIKASKPIKIQQSKLNYNKPIAKYKQNQNHNPKVRQGEKIRTKPKTKVNISPPNLPLADKPVKQEIQEQLAEKSKPENQEPEIKKLFPIFLKYEPEKTTTTDLMQPSKKLSPEKLAEKHEVKKLFPIFSKPANQKSIETGCSPAQPKTKSKTKPKLDQNLAPNIKQFMLRKVRNSESMPDTRARSENGEDRDVPAPLVYTCTQPRNGGTKHVTQNTT